MMGVEPTHTNPWQLQPGSLVLSSPPGKGMGRYQVKGKGWISALHEQLEVQFLWDLPGRKSR